MKFICDKCHQPIVECTMVLSSTVDGGNSVYHKVCPSLIAVGTRVRQSGNVYGGPRDGIVTQADNKVFRVSWGWCTVGGGPYDASYLTADVACPITVLPHDDDDDAAPVREAIKNLRERLKGDTIQVGVLLHELDIFEAVLKGR
jgi:hypothetical protein